MALIQAVNIWPSTPIVRQLTVSSMTMPAIPAMTTVLELHCIFLFLLEKLRDLLTDECYQVLPCGPVGLGVGIGVDIVALIELAVGFGC